MGVSYISRLKMHGLDAILVGVEIGTQMTEESIESLWRWCLGVSLNDHKFESS